jgi:hypothetical protein
MRKRVVCTVLLLCPFTSGCGGLFAIGTRNLLTEALLIRDSCFERTMYCNLAKEYWRDVQASDPEHDYTIAYADGFRDGFVDYLYAGGCGEPPALPPLCYREYPTEKAKSLKTVADWQAGFRQGSTVAKETGLRRLAILPIPQPPQPPPGPPPGHPGPAAPVPPVPGVGPALPLEVPAPAPVLPPPRKIGPTLPPVEVEPPEVPAHSDMSAGGIVREEGTKPATQPIRPGTPTSDSGQRPVVDLLDVEATTSPGTSERPRLPAVNLLDVEAAKGAAANDTPVPPTVELIDVAPTPEKQP